MDNEELRDARRTREILGGISSVGEAAYNMSLKLGLSEEKASKAGVSVEDALSRIFWPEAYPEESSGDAECELPEEEVPF